MADPTGLGTCPALCGSPPGVPPGAVRRCVRLGSAPNPLGVLPLVAFGLSRAAPSGGAAPTLYAGERECARARPNPTGKVLGVYVDLDAVNNDFSSKSPPLLRFDETRDYPFLDGDSADYFCSVVRFSIQTANSLPVFIPKIDPASAVVLNGIPVSTIYKISMMYVRSSAPLSNGSDIIYTSTANVQFEPDDLDIIFPRSGALPDDYYYIYNYGNFLAMINNTFDRLLHDGVLGTAMANFPCCPPFIEMDPNTLKCSITADKIFFTTSINSKPVAPAYPIPGLRVFFNSSLAALFPSFPYMPYNRTGDVNYQVMFNKQNYVNSVQPTLSALAR